MSGRGSRRQAARLLAAAAMLPLASAALGQTAQPQPSSPSPDAAELDPNAPLAPLPGLGVEWPDLNTTPTAPDSAQASVA